MIKRLLCFLMTFILILPFGRSAFAEEDSNGNVRVGNFIVMGLYVNSDGYPQWFEEYNKQFEAWKRQQGNVNKKMLDYVISNHPLWVTKEQLKEVTLLYGEDMFPLMFTPEEIGFIFSDFSGIEYLSNLQRVGLYDSLFGGSYPNGINGYPFSREQIANYYERLVEGFRRADAKQVWPALNFDTLRSEQNFPYDRQLREETTKRINAKAEEVRKKIENADLSAEDKKKLKDELDLKVAEKLNDLEKLNAYDLSTPDFESEFEKTSVKEFEKVIEKVNTPSENKKESVSAAITKVLEMGEGTLTPNASFTFEFTQKTDTDKVTDAQGKEIPVMQEPVPIADMTVAVNGKAGTASYDGKKVVEVESGNFLEKTAASANYTKAGVYVYTVKEKENTYLVADARKEKITYSKAEYRVFVYVANKDDGSVYIQSVGVIRIKNDAGEDIPETETAGKVDPTPNPNPSGDGAVSENNSKMKFTNTYLKINGGSGNPQMDENRSLQISKTVVGDLGDHTKYFDFDITVKKPEVDTETAIYKGYVIDMSSHEVVTSADNVDVGALELVKNSAYGSYIEFDLSNQGSKTQRVKLRHNQELVFTDAPVGTHFRAVEEGTANYTTGLTVKANNITVADSVNSNDSGDQILGEQRENSARFTNTYADITPTGIIMNNLSFVMLILVSVAVAVTMFVIGRKKKAAGVK